MASGAWDEVDVKASQSSHAARSPRGSISSRVRATSRGGVLDSLERLGRLYIDLARSALYLERGVGVMTYDGFRIATDFPAEIVVSDDRAPAQKTDTIINPTGGTSMTLPAQPPDSSRPGVTTWSSEVPVAALMKSIPAVARAGLTVGGELLMVTDHNPALNLDDVSLLQVYRSLQLVNDSTVRFRYVT